MQELAEGGARELQPYTQRDPDKVPLLDSLSASHDSAAPHFVPR